MRSLRQGKLSKTAPCAQRMCKSTFFVLKTLIFDILKSKFDFKLDKSIFAIPFFQLKQDFLFLLLLPFQIQ